LSFFVKLDFEEGLRHNTRGHINITVYCNVAIDIHIQTECTKKTVQSRNTAVNFGTSRIFQRHRVTSRGFHCDSTAFEINNRKNHGKISVKYVYYRPISLKFTI